MSAALEICVIRDSLESLGGSCRWVPHEQNPVDGMTKLKGNTARLLELLQTGSYKLTMEDSELAARKEYRAQTGKRNPRPKRQLIRQNHEIVQNNKRKPQKLRASRGSRSKARGYHGMP